ncbi:DUF1345 domain-containing protein [Homoserinibacter sp. GY 40078]|nr:DUF1345 domain-containing protein [Homoserinibacter sp. GY 40078]
MALALALYLTGPGVLIWIRVVVAALGLGILAALVTLNPHRLNRETRWSRVAGLSLALLLLLANQVALVQLIIDLLYSDSSDAGRILLAAVQVWVTNVIAYAFVYWEIDRGGPVVRRREPRDALPLADFRFPQDEDHDTVAEVAAGSSKNSGWTPAFIDYLYFSSTNTMAFSPTDTMPLTTRAKSLMLVEALSGFVILALVIARAVSVIG